MATDKKAVFGNEIPILTEEAYADRSNPVWEGREEGELIPILQVMYHVATHMKDKSGMIVLSVEAMTLEDKVIPRKEKALLSAALSEILDAANESLDRAEREKAEAFAAAPMMTEDGKEPNAVLVPTEGKAKLIHLDGFVDGDDLGAPLDCTRVDRVLNQIPRWGMKHFGLDLTGFVDANGIPRGLDENERIEEISGYDYIAGDCIIVGTDRSYNYLPLSPADAVTILKYFND